MILLEYIMVACIEVGSAIGMGRRLHTTVCVWGGGAAHRLMQWLYRGEIGRAHV